MLGTLLLVVAAFLGVTAFTAGLVIALYAPDGATARRRLCRAWLVAAAVFFALNAASGAVALRCPGCRDGSDSSHATGWAIGFVWSAILLMEASVGLAAGALAGSRLRPPLPGAGTPQRPEPDGRRGA